MMNRIMLRTSTLFTLGIFLLCLSLAACGSSSSTTGPVSSCDTPFNTTQEQNQTRYWVRHAIVVTVIPASGVSTALPELPHDLQSALGGVGVAIKITPDLSFAETAQFPLLVQLPSSIVASFVLNTPVAMQSKMCDADIFDAVTRINAQSSIPVMGSGGMLGKIEGASPDWTFGSSQTGDHIHGSPGGPPSTNSNIQVKNFPTGTSATASSVVIFDTGYNPATLPDPAQLAAATPTPVPSTPSCPPVKDMVATTYASPPVALPFSVAGINTSTSGGTNEAQWLGFFNTSAFGEVYSPVSEDYITSAQRRNGFCELPYVLTDPTSPPTGSKAYNPVNIQDHGLFISSIIHALAPSASIRLVRVLNDYGAGDLATLEQAFAVLLHSPATWGLPAVGDASHHVIINLSLTMSVKSSCLHNLFSLQSPNSMIIPNSPEQLVSPPANAYLSDAGCASESALGADPNDFAQAASAGKLTPAGKVLLPLALSLQDLAANNYTIVAAAGNDGAGEYANAPAAFCSTYAVASLTNGAAQNRASAGTSGDTFAATELDAFSNLPYIDGSNDCIQVTTSSSAVARLSLESGQNRGRAEIGTNLCGVHILKTTPSGGLPPYAMVNWSGTSFATASASGVTAQIFEDGTTPASIEEQNILAEPTSSTSPPALFPQLNLPCA